MAKENRTGETPSQKSAGVDFSAERGIMKWQKVIEAERMEQRRGITLPLIHIKAQK